MLKRLLLAALVLTALICPSFASMMYEERDDIGDGAVKERIEREMFKLKNETGQSFRQQRARLYDFQKGFHGLREEEIIALFGPKSEKTPQSFALPLYDSGGVVLSGFFGSREVDKSHTDFYDVGDFAGAKVIYGRSGQVARILFFFRVNAAFPKLEGWNNLKARLEWDDSQLAALETWVAQRKQKPAETL